MAEITKLNDGPARVFHEGVAVGTPKRLRIDLEKLAAQYGVSTLVLAMLDDEGHLIVEGV